MRVEGDHLVLLVRPLVDEGFDVVVCPEGLDCLERGSMHFLSKLFRHVSHLNVHVDHGGLKIS